MSIRHITLSLIRGLTRSICFNYSIFQFQTSSYKYIIIIYVIAFPICNINRGCVESFFAFIIYTMELYFDITFVLFVFFPSVYKTNFRSVFDRVSRTIKSIYDVLYIEFGLHLYTFKDQILPLIPHPLFFFQP